MSEANVEVVRRMWEAFVGDNPENGLAFCAPDIEWDGTNLPDGRIERGHQAVVAHAERWAATWNAEWRMEVEQLIDAGGDQVIVFFRELGRSDSGLQLDERHAELYRLRDGMVVYRKGFRHPAEAVAAAGLPTQDARAGS
jgi:ketosteroid isomerase-like protein